MADVHRVGDGDDDLEPSAYGCKAKPSHALHFKPYARSTSDSAPILSSAAETTMLTRFKLCLGSRKSSQGQPGAHRN